MNITKTDSLQGQRCPYLGLHDDPSTSLAFPSTWNYCYHATPPAAVRVSHQEDACLCPQFVRCTVYQTGTTDPLPADLRGKANAWQRDSSRKSIRLFLAGLLIVALALLALLRFDVISVPVPKNLRSLPFLSFLLSDRTPADPAEASTPQMAGDSSPVTPSLPVSTASRVSIETTATQSAMSSLVSSPLKTTFPEGVCGHALDVPFGREAQFVIHQVVEGENLTLYAGQYDTSTTAILAVNYHLPTPVWEGWILVIPMGTGEVSGLPTFEPYHAVGASLSLDELARQLNTDAATLAEYNGFEGRCTTFSGWLLIPRQLQKP